MKTAPVLNGTCRHLSRLPSSLITPAPSSPRTHLVPSVWCCVPFSRNYSEASIILRRLLGRLDKTANAHATADLYATLAYGNLMLDTLPDRKSEEGNRKAMNLLQRVRVTV